MVAASRSSSAAARAGSSCSSELTPTMGRTCGERCRSQASTTWLRATPSSAATAVSAASRAVGPRVVVGGRERAVVAVEAALHQRAVGPQLDAVVALEVVDRLVGDPAEPVVLALDRGAGPRRDVRRGQLQRARGLEAARPGVVAGALDQPGGVVGDADATHGAGGDELAEGLGGLLDRRTPVLTVRPVEVDAVDAQALEAAAGLAAHGVGAQALHAAAVQRLDAHLGREGEPLAEAGVGAQPLADERLALSSVTGPADPEGVAVGGVEGGAPGLDEAVEQGEGRGPVGAGAEVHGAEDEVGDHPTTLAPRPGGDEGPLRRAPGQA